MVITAVNIGRQCAKVRYRLSVMTFIGHADYDTMKPYIALTDKTRQSALLSSFKMGGEKP